MASHSFTFINCTSKTKRKCSVYFQHVNSRGIPIPKMLTATSCFLVEDVSISNTYVNHPTEKSSVILMIVFCLFFSKKERALERSFCDNWGHGFFLLKESLSQEVSSWSLLASLVASRLARCIMLYICERAGLGRMWVRVCIPTHVHICTEDGQSSFPLQYIRDHHESRYQGCRESVPWCLLVCLSCVCGFHTSPGSSQASWWYLQSVQLRLMSLSWIFLVWIRLNFFFPLENRHWRIVVMGAWEFTRGFWNNWWIL